MPNPDSPAKAPPAPEGAAGRVASVEAQLRRGEPLLAFNAAQEALGEFPGHVRLRQLQALALARSGDPARAATMLQTLADEGHGDAETLGMLARTRKDLAQRAPAGPLRDAHLQAGLRLYERAWREAAARGDDGDALYTGINAATLACAAGDAPKAREIAMDVRRRAERADGAGDAPARYWREATLGEAALVLGDGEAAALHYRAAAKLAEGRYGDLATTRRQARWLLAHLPGADANVLDALAIAPVLVFTGHMIDAPGREAPRFPAALEPAVRAALRERIAALAPVAAFGSAACGADLLCLEIARELGAETHVVLPFPAEAFRRASVDFAGGEWGARFERALAAAASVSVASDHRASGSTATFDYANRIAAGTARLRAGQLDTAVQGLAAWDPHAPAAAGGAASAVALWEAGAIAYDAIDIGALRGETAAGRAPEAAPAPAEAPAVRHELRALLFADAVGYSQLAEDQIPAYITGFLGAVAALNARTAHRFEHVETSGDGLYMVFRDPLDAGRYALELSALVAGFDRAACGLPPTFDLRIALHCGPVHCARDPITGSPMYTGPHTSRAARIEPITPPGQVYASSAFAAVAAASGAGGLALRYVGRIPLAKGYGTLGLYSVGPGAD